MLGARFLTAVSHIHIIHMFSRQSGRPGSCCLASRHEAWAATNNMQLNNAKRKEIVFRSRSKCGKEVQLPPSQPDMERVNSNTELGVDINYQLTATDHVSYILTACTSLLYALCVLCCHSIPDQSLKDVFHRLLYYPKLLTACQHGLGSVQQLIVQDSTPF